MHSIIPITVNADGFIHILDSVPTNYAVVFACGSFDKQQVGQMAWILSRTTTLAATDLTKAVEVLNQQKIDTSSLLATDHAGC